MTCNRFVIRNDWAMLLMLNIEPEGSCFALKKGEEVAVVDTYADAPVTLKFTSSDDGEPVLSIWPGDGEVRVEKDGVNVFDLLAPQRVHT